ncbi:hypothetical protein ACEUBN_04570 [Aeromonas veronii]|uniref:hypothetical protein n=1 Tax=unclassified Aeromonas TaxID=257493 RepID=UPI0022E07FC9|nr:MULTISPECIES: hypothetical protein [unclassified Aeromonas]
MTILPVYAALLALLFVLLSIRTIRTRHSRKVALGHGDDLHGDPGERGPYPDHGAAPLTRPSLIAGEAVWQPSPSAILHCTDSRNSAA